MGLPYNENISEALAVVGQIAPQSTSTTVTTAAFNSAGFFRVMAILNLGTLGSSATVNAHFTASATSGGSYATITGTTITQITSGSTNLVLVEIKAESLAGASIGPWLKFSVTVGTAASLVSAVVVGSYCYSPRPRPARPCGSRRPSSTDSTSGRPVFGSVGHSPCTATRKSHIDVARFHHHNWHCGYRRGDSVPADQPDPDGIRLARVTGFIRTERWRGRRVYPASPAVISSGSAGTQAGFIYIPPLSATGTITLTATCTGGLTATHSISLPIGTATTITQDIFSGTAATALESHTGGTGATWTKVAASTGGLAIDRRGETLRHWHSPQATLCTTPRGRAGGTRYDATAVINILTRGDGYQGVSVHADDPGGGQLIRLYLVLRRR